jgi:hypothetical protein
MGLLQSVLGSKRRVENEDTSKALDFAWQVHAAVSQWSGRVDTKASIVLTLELAVFGAITAFSKGQEPLSNLSGTRLVSYRIGIILLAVSAMLAGIVVFPQLRRRRARRNWQLSLIYFGHLRRWEPTDLARRLAELSSQDQLSMLSRQLVATSQVTWTKNHRLQWSMLTAFAGVVLVVISAITNL